MEQRVRVVRGLVAAAAISIVLYVARVIFYGDFTFGYMIWNLVLAVIPFFIGVALIDRLQGRLWSEPANLALTLLWLGFLPNSFYVATDLIHIAEVTSRSLCWVWMRSGRSWNPTEKRTESPIVLSLLAAGATRVMAFTCSRRFWV